ncbi:MAG: hypothetical protein K9L56_15200 [Clostridiales bacterium]|nr:hypothetical protein [Clostridiales bacterium]
MGAFPKAEFEDMTDMLAKRVEPAIITPASDMLSSNANQGLATYLDANSTDAQLQSALLDDALNVDRQALTTNLYDYYRQILSVDEWTQFASAVVNYVKSDAGGAYASFAAYLSGVSAEVHPLAAEVFRVAAGENVFTDSGSIVGAMHPQMDVVDFDAVFAGTQGSLSDITSAATNTGSTSNILEADNDVLVVGSRSKFTAILMDLDTVSSADLSENYYYYDGDSWQSLSVTSNMNAFRDNGGAITFDAPSDWEPHYMDMQGTPAKFADANEEELYYVIIERTGDTAATTPILTWAQAVPEAVNKGAADLYGVAQPPLALVVITAANTATVTVPQQPDTDRWAYLDDDNSQLQVQAITNHTGNVSFTLGYVDDSGNAAETASSVTLSTPSAGDTADISLNSTDLLASVSASDCAVTTDETAGCLIVRRAAYERAITAK